MFQPAHGRSLTDSREILSNTCHFTALFSLLSNSKVRLCCQGSADCFSSPLTRSSLSAGSLSTSRPAEAGTVRQPSKSRIRRHTNRLSGVFLRGPTQASLGSMALTAAMKSPLSIQSRKGSGESLPAAIGFSPLAILPFSHRCGLRSGTNVAAVSLLSRCVWSLLFTTDYWFGVLDGQPIFPVD